MSRSGIVESTSKTISKFYIYFRSIDNLMPTPGLVTSQIVLMNPHGVAMASDSAVTYGDDRTFERVNKIFHMGGKHEISFMISGNAIFSPGGIAWPRVIGLFSNHIGPEPLKNVDEYVDRLRIFLEESQEINDSLQNDISVRNSLSKWFRSIPPVMELFHWLDLIDGSTQSGSAYMEGFDWGEARTKFREGFDKWMDWIESEFLGKNAKEMKRDTGTDSLSAAEWVAMLLFFASHSLHNRIHFVPSTSSTGILTTPFLWPLLPLIIWAHGLFGLGSNRSR